MSGHGLAREVRQSADSKTAGRLLTIWILRFALWWGSAATLRG
jgi:hypothetical protein